MTDPAIETLLWEYREVQQGLREQMSGMDKNIATAFSVFGIIASIGVGLKETRFLYLIPTLIFLFLMNHMTKTISLGTGATYCFMIETKLRSRFGPGEILMDWEGGSLGFESRDPFSLFGLGVLLAFLPVAAGFIYLSVECYSFLPLSGFIHLFEAILLIGYAYGCLRWNRKAYRKRIAARSQESISDDDKE